MHLWRLLAVLAVTACSTAQPIALRVRDPWLVEIDRIDPHGRPVRALAPHDAQRDDCPWRDQRGFPHFCSWGAYGTRDDGTIQLLGVRDDAAGDVRVRFSLRYPRPCRRARRGGCWASAPMELVTAEANVAWIGAYEAPGEPVVGPEVGRDHALAR